MQTILCVIMCVIQVCACRLNLCREARFGKESSRLVEVVGGEIKVLTFSRQSWVVGGARSICFSFSSVSSMTQ